MSLSFGNPTLVSISDGGVVRRVLLLGLVTACTNDGGEDPGPGPGTEGPSGEPMIEITGPADGSGSYDGSFDLAFSVQNFTLDPGAMGGSPETGRGHVHVYVDGQLVAETAEEEATVDTLGAGDHEIVVRLAGNDHSELPANDSLAVVVQVPTIEIVSPADGAVLAASSTPLVFAVEDFVLSPSIGGDDVFGEGHFRILVDGELRDWGSDPLTAMATGMTEGRHSIKVELVKNDGTPMDPPVVAEVDVEVPIGAKGVFWDRSAFGTAYESATLPIALTTSNFLLFPREDGRPPVDGEGHLHLFMDGAWLDATADTSRVLQNVAPGPHLFEARLVSNDGFELPVVDRMWVTVASDRPDVLITYPGASWTMAPDFDLLFGVENFTLDAASIGGANAYDVGHAQVFVDGVLAAENADGVVPLTGLLPGTHLVRVQLANNDRTPVEPAVYQEFDIVVESAAP